MGLPEERKTFEFEQASVIFRIEDSPAAGRELYRLEVMVLDAYAYQREFILQLRNSGTSKELFWEAHTYHHPDRRNIQTLTWRNAEHFILKFLDLCEKYPTLLFNATDNPKGTPRSVGFVHLSERLLRGEPCSDRLLK